MKVWLLFSGNDNGDREDASIFYAEPKVFLNEERARNEERELKINNGIPENIEDYNGSFYTLLYSKDVEE